MGTPLFAANVLFAPLQQLARWMGRSIASVPSRSQAMAPAGHAARAHLGRTQVGRTQVARTQVARAQTAVRRPAPALAARTARLRVVRVFEGPHLAANAGRMVISGRMADVCAELDRLAALEAAAG